MSSLAVESTPATSALSFTVFGVAAAKGSARAFMPKGWKRPIITSTNRNAKAWEALVAEAAGRALNGVGQLFHGPVRLSITFYLPRPKSLSRTKAQAHLTKPDCSKLIRSTEDALTGVIWRDDSQVVDLHATKQYAGLGETPRAIVTIEPLSLAERL